MKKRNRRRSISRSCRARRTQFEALEQRCVLSATPTLAPIADLTLYEGAPINLPLDAIYDLDGPLTYTVECSDPNVTVYVPEGNRSMKISVSAENGTITGDMIFELFEQRVPRVTHQIISLAEDGFYDGLTFHRIINNFMIQGGDPTGTGTGNSYLGNFDDQFHTELMHTSSGVLSMAKPSVDDSNDCQFFITERPTRQIDFNHSVFGQLVEGEDIREALSNVDTDTTINTDPEAETDDIPINTVTIESVEIFEDTENAILVISAPEDYTNSNVTITVTIHDESGNDYVQTPINVTIEEDLTYDNENEEWVELNSEPFFSDFPILRTDVDTPFTLDFSPYVQDIEGLGPFETPGEGEEIDYEHSSFFLDDYALNYFDEYVPYVENEALGYGVDFYTGVATFTPTGGMVGTYPFSIATGVSLGYLDSQVAALNVVPDEAPEANITMTLVNDPTTVDDQGEVSSLPANDDWLTAWDQCSMEVWAKIDDPGQFGIYSIETDLSFNPELYQVSDIEWGVGFNQEQTGTIDNANGTVTDLGGTTKWYSIDPYGGNDGNYPSSGPEDVIMWGDDQYVLVARVNLQPVYTNEDLKVKPGIGYNTEAATAGFSLSNGDVKWNEVDAADVTLGGNVNTDMWAVPYDLNNDAVVNIIDVLNFLGYYEVDINAPGNDWGYACDFDHNGQVQMTDLLLMLGQYQYTAVGGNIELHNDFPFDDASQAASQSASLMGTLAASDLANHNDSQDDDEDSENQIDAVDQIMLMYGDV